MDKEQRIKILEQEIEQLNYHRLKFQEQMQQAQVELQQKLMNVNEGVLTRRGEIICLQRMTIEEKKEDGFNST